MIYFISGHMDLTKEEFDIYYVPMLQSLLQDLTNSFVVGDCFGADLYAQNYLYRKGIKNVVIYHKGDVPRNNPHEYKTVGGFGSHSAKDAAMTYISDIDVAWVRQGKKNSGTANNIKRREKEKFSYR